MGGHGSGRKDKTTELLRNTQVEKRTPIATDMFLPNLSGDHSAGTTTTPTNDTDIANKKYVDDNAGTGTWTDTSTNTGSNKSLALGSNTITGTKAEFDVAVTDGNIAYSGGVHHDGFSDFVANEHIDWTSTTSNFSTSGTAATGALTVTGNTTISGDLGITADTDLIQMINGEVDINGDLLATGDIFGLKLSATPVQFGNVTASETISSQLDFKNAGGADNTDIAFDLDGTRPRIFSTTDNTIEISEALIVTGTLDVRGGIIEDTDSEDLIIRTNSVANQLRLELGGNVGIGSSADATKLTVDGAVSLKEQAAADADTAAYGQIWVKTATPNQLFFTDDAGTDVQLGAGGGGTDLTTKGDIHGYDTTQKRIPIGTNDQVLTADSAQTLGLKWATPTGSGAITSWSEVTGTSQTMVVNTGYILNNASEVDAKLPATASVGDVVRVTGKGAGKFKISQNAGDIIHNDGADSLTGSEGGWRAGHRYDGMELVCTVANDEWNVISSIGTFSSFKFSEKSILFDGVDETLNVADLLTNVLTSTTVGTWSLWVKPVDATPATVEAFIGFGDANAAQNIDLRTTTGGKLQGVCRRSSSVKWKFNTDAVVFSDATWTHIAMVQDGVEPVLYVNGSLEASTFSASIDKTEWFNNFTGLDTGRIGNLDTNNSDTFFFNGNIDDPTFWDTNLNATEITELYNLGVPKDPTTHSKSANLVGYYQMGDNASDTNTTIIDASSNSNDATGVNLESGDLEEDTPPLG